MPDPLYPVATSRDMPRQAATDPTQYTLTIEDALIRYEHAGYPRTTRSVQRYCTKGHLDCLRQETTYGDKFMITPESVTRHIAQIAELASATSRDMPRQAATSSIQESGAEIAENLAATVSDMPRHVATAQPEQPQSTQIQAPTSTDMPRQAAASRDLPTPEHIQTSAGAIIQDSYTKRLETEIEWLQKENEKKDHQLTTKDLQISSLHKTLDTVAEQITQSNILMQNFQRLLGLQTPRLPQDEQGSA